MVVSRGSPRQLAQRKSWPLDAARHLLALRAHQMAEILLYRGGFFPPREVS